MTTYFNWSNTCTDWGVSCWNWGDCQIVQEVVAALQPPGPDANTLIPPWLEEPWDPYRAGEEDKRKRKRLIQLICKVKGIEYNEEKMMKNFRVSTDDVKLVVKEVSGIDLNLKMER